MSNHRPRRISAPAAAVDEKSTQPPLSRPETPVPYLPSMRRGQSTAANMRSARSAWRAGLAWVASIAIPGVDYLQLGGAFTVAGVGTSLCFPTVAHAIMRSIPMEEAGAASGANSALRELGGVLGVAILASVFIHRGGYTNPYAFIHGFAPAVWVAVGLSAIGVIAAVLTGGRAQPREVPSIAVGLPEAQAA